MSKILIVDDDREIASLIGDSLYDEGYETLLAYDGEIALEKVSNNLDLEMIILDIMMPKVDGLEVCRKIREKVSCPIIFVSAKSRTLDTVLGLEIGADDYITKPFIVDELVARVKAHLARYDRLVGSNQQTQGDTFQIRDIKIDKSARRVWIRGEETQFTTKEFELLAFLAEHPNHVFSKQELFKEIWDMDSVGDIATVTVHIKKIREKIELNTNKPQYIETIWGVGYRFKV